jgi:hypothetical protein
VIRPTGWVETRVIPVAEVAVYPRRYIGVYALSCFVGDGADEGFQKELIGLVRSDVTALSEGRDHIVSLLVVVVAVEIRKRGEFSGCGEGEVVAEDGFIVDFWVEGGC